MTTDQSQKSTIEESVPAVWPGAFKLYAVSKAAIMHNLGAFLGLTVLTIVVGIAGSMVNPNRTFTSTSSVAPSGAGSLIYLLCQLVTILLSAALVYVVIAGVKRQKLSVDESLRAGWTKYLIFFMQSLLLGLIAFASFIFLIVPAFIILPRLALAQYYLLEGNMNIVDSIKASWYATKGNVGKVWGIVGVNILIALLCITIIGIPFAIYLGLMYQGAFPVLYMYLKSKPSISVPQTATPSIPTPPQS